MTRQLAEALIRDRKNKQIFMKTNYTPTEYKFELLKFQSMLAKNVMGDESAKMNEVIAYLETAARERGIDRNPEIIKGINGLKILNKEIAISMAGQRAEDFVACSLNYVERSDFITFRNMYIADADIETELDNVVLTNNGIIILEVKAAKTDITISEDGRILYENSIAYHDHSIGEKMEIKRRLLKTKLEAQLKERGLSIPLHIDSYIVFSTPKHLHVSITDKYQMEKYCRRSRLQFLLSEYISETVYSQDEFEKLKEILEGMESCKKTFSIEVNFDEIWENFMKTYMLLTKNTETVEKENKAQIFRWLPHVASVAAITLFLVTTIKSINEGGI